ncbi:protein ZNRD2-like isoform X2 [Oratosquilla oratoria]|uniref:protein ZNRD2-like isoform X2 n=1 Tax=Oratosquilla oratoria TaxID=337810 RepID=UPI003F766FC5
MASNDDNSWTPPSEAELKVIEARRERNNKISALMGQYLLKGYKMLASACPVCDCVLLEDRQKNKYCIGCCEVDADTRKDNPAVSEEAARRTVAEIEHRQSSRDKSEERCEGNSRNITVSSHSHNDFQEPPRVGIFNTLLGRGQQRHKDMVHKQVNGIEEPSRKRYTQQSDEINKGIEAATKALSQKLIWVAQQLEATNGVTEAHQLASLVKETCEALCSLKALAYQEEC